MSDPTVIVTETERVLVRDEPDERVISVREDPSNQLVVDGSGSTLVTAVEQERVVVTAPGPRGPQGPPGVPGAAGGLAGTTTHIQENPSTNWTIIHDLGFYPNVTIVDTSGTEIEG